MVRLLSLIGLVVAARCVVPCRAAEAASAAATSEKPAPTVVDYRYGPHERHTFDLWLAKSATPTPLFLYIHGGGFDVGAKSDVPASNVVDLLARGVSVMSTNYRLTPDAKYPEHYLDCARALQTVRRHAGEWNIDSRRVALSGASAGGVASLWLAFHDDLADASSDDPVARESTRVTCVAAISTPVSLDPRNVRAWVGDNALQHRFFQGRFFRIAPAAVETPAGLALHAEASPINLITAGDPPVFAFYTGPLEVDETGDSPGVAIHHYQFGVQLKQRMDAAGVACELEHLADPATERSRVIDFLVEHLR